MKPLSEFQGRLPKYFFTDIDDTMTDEGHLGPQAYTSLWNLQKAGVIVVPVTGRPAGWCEMIARVWPVAGVIGENGGFYFRYLNKKMRRYFAVPDSLRLSNRKKLDEIVLPHILKAVPGSALASDQFTRLMDLAIDFCEDVSPLSKTDVQKIVDIFEGHGAIAKVSSIHVNGWFGDYDKLTTCQEFLKREFKEESKSNFDHSCFVGDSPNDEPMFKNFALSFAVSNIRRFEKDLSYKPTFVAQKPGGQGFTDIVNHLLDSKL